MENIWYYLGIIIYIVLWVGVWGLTEIFIEYLVSKHNINRVFVNSILVVICTVLILSLNLKK
jgi:hypothetical protein